MYKNSAQENWGHILMQTIQEIKKSIGCGLWDASLIRLYGQRTAVLARQRQRYIDALDQFAALFGEKREVNLYSVPGRTEIGGNHTDHNHGVVLAGAVDLDVIAVVGQNDESIVRVQSKGFEGMDVVDLANLSPVPEETGHSASLIRGVAAGIARENGTVGGFDAYTVSDVLRGSGLSSSAAFEVLLGAIWNGEYNADRFSPIDIAQISQYAENAFFGKPSGLMDQMACSVGGVITIDFADPAAPSVEKVTLDLEKYGYALCITDTKGSHAALTGEYAAVRSEMEAAAGCFGKKVLREVEEDAFFAEIARVRREVGDRAVLRAIHFFADSRRAAQMRNAVKEDRFPDFLRLITEGGHSSFEYNQNAYSAASPQEQGVSLGLALSQRILNGRGAWRLHGGGFAGTIQAFVPLDLVETFQKTMDNVFGAGACHILNVRADGAVRLERKS